MKEKDRWTLSHFENPDEAWLRVEPELENAPPWAYLVSGEQALFGVLDLRFDIAAHCPSLLPNYLVDSKDSADRTCDVNACPRLRASRRLARGLNAEGR